MNKNLKHGIICAAFLLTSIGHAGEFNPEKMHEVSNVALGIDPSARGDRFKLMKDKPLTADMLHNTNVLAGAAGAMAVGANPVSPSGAGLANKISVGLDLLSIFSKKEKLYAPNQTFNALFGKFYLKESHDNDFDATEDALNQIATKIVAASKDVLEADAAYRPEYISQQATKNHLKDLRKIKIETAVAIYLNDGSVMQALVRAYPLVKPELKNNRLGFEYAYENQHPYQLTISFRSTDAVTKKSSAVILKDILQDDKYQEFVAKMTDGGNFVLFTNDLKNTYYDGQHYVESEELKTVDTEAVKTN